MMDGRRGGRRRGDQTLLPSRRATISCWYCDFKCLAFNDALFHLGRRHSRFLRVWFSIAIGFSMAALVGVTIIILCEMAKAPLLYSGIARSGDSSFGFSFLTAGMHMSPSSMGYLCLSSFISVMVHEFGHVLAAASSVKVCRWSILLSFLLWYFQELWWLLMTHHCSYCLEWLLSEYIVLFCGVCTLALFFLPFFLSPLYIHGESPMVLSVHSMSPLSGYLSAYDVIRSLDEFCIYTAEEWKQKIAVSTKQTRPLSFGQSSGIVNVQKSYCFPRSLIEKSIHIPFTGYETYCPNELFAFALATCPDTSKYDYSGNKTNHRESG